MLATRLSAALTYLVLACYLEPRQATPVTFSFGKYGMYVAVAAGQQEHCRR